MRILLLLCFVTQVLPGLYAQAKYPPPTPSEDEDNGLPEITDYDLRGDHSYYITETWPNGNKKVEGLTVNDEKHGAWILYSEVGGTEAVMNYEYGIIHGTSKGYYRDPNRVSIMIL
jgi:hypothetical protein